MINYINYHQRMLFQYCCTQARTTKAIAIFLLAGFSFLSPGLYAQLTTTTCGYKVSVVSSYNSTNNTTTFTYSITNTNPGSGLNGTFKDLSHWGFLNPCFPSSKIVGGRGSYTTGEACKPGIPLIKFDGGTSGTSTATFTLVLQGGYSLVLSDAYFKAGTSCCTGKVYAPKCCLFQVTCPTNKNLGTFNCTNLNNIPALPATLNSLKAAPYNILIGITSCGAIRFKVTDDKVFSTCSRINQTVNRTITLWDDVNGNGLLDTNEQRQTCTFTYTVEADTKAPYIKCPPDTVVSCIGNVPAYNIARVYATDNCGKVYVSFVKDSVVGSCPKVIYRIYKAKDECGNISYCTQKITVDDKKAPYIKCPADTVVSCIADVPAYNTARVYAKDNCGKVWVSFVKDSAVGSCPKIIYRIYKAKDECGNTSYCTQKITVEDKKAPYIKCPADTVVSCIADVPAYNTARVYAKDNCGKVWVSFVKDSAVGSCPKIIYRIYKAKDECGNVSYCRKRITVEDKKAPYIKCPEDITVSCEENVPAHDITKVYAKDYCGDVWVSFVKDSVVGSCPKIIYRIYKAKDECGNVSYCRKRITVEDKK